MVEHLEVPLPRRGFIVVKSIKKIISHYRNALQPANSTSSVYSENMYIKEHRVPKSNNK